MRCCIACLMLLCGTEAHSILAQTAVSKGWKVNTLSVPLLGEVPRALNFDGVDFSPGEPDSIRGIIVDLNRDNQPDFLIRSEPGLCGVSANCAFAVVDGATLRVLGILEGAEVIVRPSHPGTWPLLQVVAHLGAAEALVVSFVHDGQEYRMTGSRRVEGAGYAALQRELESLPARTASP